MTSLVSATTLRTLNVIPGDEAGPAMIFAKRHSASLVSMGVDNRDFFLSSRVSPAVIIREGRRLRRLIEEFSPHVVHAQYGTVTSFLTVAVSSRPVVVQFQGSDLLARRVSLRTVCGKLLSQLSALRATRIICVSEELKRSLWWRRQRARVILAGVDLEVFAPRDKSAARRDLGWDPSVPVVIFNAGSDPWIKRLDLAQGAIELIRPNFPGLRFVVLDGKVDPDKIPNLLNAADCLLLTSRYEGSPNVVKEAIACGLPVVSVDVGDVRARLHTVTPSCVVAPEPEAIAAAVASILHNPVRSNGPSATEDFGLRQITQTTIDLYREAAGH